MITVVAALIAHEGKILITQRPAGKAYGGFWEFPGGKIEDGESPEAALERELREELGIRTVTGAILDAAAHTADGWNLLILYYRSRWVSGKVVGLEGQSIQWGAPGELSQYRFLPADRALIEKLARGEIALSE